MIRKDSFTSEVFQGDSTASSDYLNVSELEEGREYRKIAYVANATTGWQKNDHGFITFYLKDVNGDAVTARLFNVADFMLSGVKSSAMRHHFVEIKFQSQIFKGNVNLVLETVKLVELQNQGELLPRFIGTVDVDTTTLDKIYDNLHKPLPSKFKGVSLERIANGRVGGYVKMMDMALSGILGATDLPGINADELFFVFLQTANYYFDLLEHRQELSEVDDFEDYKILTRIDMELQDSDSRFIVIDTVRALASNQEPGTLPSFIVAHAIKVAMFTLNTSYRMKNTPFGVKVNLGGSSLLKM